MKVAPKSVQSGSAQSDKTFILQLLGLLHPRQMLPPLQTSFCSLSLAYIVIWMGLLQPFHILLGVVECLKEHGLGLLHKFPLGTNFQRASITIHLLCNFGPPGLTGTFHGRNHLPFPNGCQTPQANHCLCRPCALVALSITSSLSPSCFSNSVNYCITCSSLIPVISLVDQSLTQHVTSILHGSHFSFQFCSADSATASYPSYLCSLTRAIPEAHLHLRLQIIDILFLLRHLILEAFHGHMTLSIVVSIFVLSAIIIARSGTGVFRDLIHLRRRHPFHRCEAFL